METLLLKKGYDNIDAITNKKEIEY